MKEKPTHKVKVRVLKGELAKFWNFTYADYRLKKQRMNSGKVDGITPKLKTQENPDYTKGLEGFY